MGKKRAKMPVIEEVVEAFDGMEALEQLSQDAVFNPPPVLKGPFAGLPKG